MVDIGGIGIFARLTEVSLPRRDVVSLTQVEDSVVPEAPIGRVQLLATVRLDGIYVRGLVRHPRFGDAVYTASDDVLSCVVSAGSLAAWAGEPIVQLGRLTAGDSVKVALPASGIFGRHLAVLGATGAGKSWTLTHLMEEVGRLGGRLLLIDATGEFHTMGDQAGHIAFGSTDEEPQATQLASLPHYLMSESDRTAFLRPAGASQLPKMRSAIRSLRLAAALGDSHALISDGTIPKARLPRAPFEKAALEQNSIVEDSSSVFDLRKLAEQLRLECIWETDQRQSDRFGDYNNNELGYCNSLISRVRDFSETPEVMSILDAQTRSVFTLIDYWLREGKRPVLRLSLKNMTFSHSLREIVVNAIGRWLLAEARAGRFKGRPVVVAVDEAHQFFGRSVGDDLAPTNLDSFEVIAKEGRKYGLTVCMATQRPGDLPGGVLSQVGALIVHRLADKRDRDRVESASSELDQSAMKLLPALTPGEALLVGAAFPVPLPVKIARPQHEPSSQGPNYATGWSTPSPP